MLTSRLMRFGLVIGLTLGPAACTSPVIGNGFDGDVFANSAATQTMARLRLPPGTDLNSPVRLELVEGKVTDTDAETETFDLKRVGRPQLSASGSVILDFEFDPRDFRRYDRARTRIDDRLSAGDPAGIRVDHDLCHRAGLEVERPFVVGFLLINRNQMPIYLAEKSLPESYLRWQLPYCV